MSESPVAQRALEVVSEEALLASCPAMVTGLWLMCLGTSEAATVEGMYF